MILTVYAETRRPATCRSCGAPIVWAETAKNRKRIPFDPPLVVVHASHGFEDVDTTITKTHFATCPHAKTWRRS